MTTQSPLVSIIMPAYNVQSFIKPAIDSVLSQTWTHWELLIMDDGSTDATPLIAQMVKDPRIRYTRLDRIGCPAGVRNEGIKRCSGELVFFFDADDLLYPTAIDVCVKPFLKNSRVNASYGFMTHIDQQGHPLPFAGFKLRPQPDKTWKVPGGYHHSWQKIALGRFVATPNLMIRRQTLLDVGCFDTKLKAAEDIHLQLKLFLHDFNSIVYVPHYTMKYRRNLESLTRKRQNIETLLSSHLQVIHWFFAQPDCPDFIHAIKSQAICRRYHYVAGVCLTQGYNSLAVDIAMRPYRDPHIRWHDALRISTPILLRCMLPAALDLHLKHWVVILRDGAFRCSFPNWTSKSRQKHLSQKQPLMHTASE